MAKIIAADSVAKHDIDYSQGTLRVIDDGDCRVVLLVEEDETIIVLSVVFK